MKKNDIEVCLQAIQGIKNFSDRQTYNISSAINTNIIKIVPILKKELERMENDKVTINCPAIEIIDEVSITAKKDLQKLLNDKLKQLVLSDYKIIDFGIFGNGNMLSAYIKYTS